MNNHRVIAVCGKGGVGAIVGVVLCVIYYLLMVCLGVGTVMYRGF